MTDNFNFIGLRVKMAAGDHEYAYEEGIVIGIAPCSLCNDVCGYKDLIVRLDDGVITRVYEPEVDIVE